jgi:DtxR family Mn-dependent transcriptional regulator
MEISDEAEEILEDLWSDIVEKKNSVTLKSLNMERNDNRILELHSLGLVELEENHVNLTLKGKDEARGTIRRHRLAERLLADLLDTREGYIEEMSCKMEHALYKGVDESICTILGHPKVCPHGAPIPPGRCCKKAGRQAERVDYEIPFICFSAGSDPDSSGQGDCWRYFRKANKLTIICLIFHLK